MPREHAGCREVASEVGVLAHGPRQRGASPGHGGEDSRKGAGPGVNGEAG